MSKRLKVCYFGSYDLSEPHNSTYLQGLRTTGIEVVECKSSDIKNRDSKEYYDNIFKIAGVVISFFKNNIALFFTFIKLKNIDTIIVGYPGQFDLLLAKMFSKIRNIPLIFNVHITLYETLVLDRNYFGRESAFSKFLKTFDRLLFKLSDVVIVDTASHGDFYSELYRIPREKFVRVFIGADVIFRPMDFPTNGKFNVLFYGTFIPLQGIETIVEAAHSLKNEKDVRFKLIGKGQTKEQVVKLADELQTTNIDFVEWVSREELVQEISKANVCLGGQFGVTEKADLVIGYKCFQMIAMKKPVVVSNSKGNRELLQDGKNCIFGKPGDSKSLVKAIIKLKKDSDLREKIAENARSTFTEKCSPSKIGAELRKIIENAINARKINVNFRTL